MKIAAFVHPRRCTHPLGGVGRHAAEILRELAEKPSVGLELLVSRQHVDGNGRLGADSALPRVPLATFPFPENLAERFWKAFGWPRVDGWADGANWIYSPMETYLPTKRVPVAITIHDVQAFETDLPWSQTAHHRRWRAKWSVWIRKALRDSRVVFTVSEFSKGRIVKLLDADPCKIVVVGNGVGAEFFSIKRRKEGGSGWYALVIGGLRRKKGGAEVLAVARELQKRSAESRIVTVGLSEPDLVEEARGLTNLEVRGSVGESELHELLGGATSLLFLSHYEGFGLPAIEAMAARVPVIASKLGALPETTGRAAILVDPCASSEIAELIVELERDTQRRASLVSLGYQHATGFRWEHCAERVYSALKERG